MDRRGARAGRLAVTEADVAPRTEASVYHLVGLPCIRPLQQPLYACRMATQRGHLQRRCAVGARCVAQGLGRDSRRVPGVVRGVGGWRVGVAVMVRVGGGLYHLEEHVKL